MRSKAKARRLAQDDPSQSRDFQMSPSIGRQSADVTHDLTDDESTSSLSPPPPEILTCLPKHLELQQSQEMNALGIWTRRCLPKGSQFGSFTGVLTSSVQDTNQALEVVDEQGKVSGWLDMSQAGTGANSWMKYVRSTHTPHLHNLMTVQIRDQVYYRSIRDIQPGEEMLLFANDPVYREKPHDCLSYEDEKQFPCAKCGELFRSKVALRRHETYVCNNTNAIFATLNRQFKESQAAAVATTNASVSHQVSPRSHLQTRSLAGARIARAASSQEIQGSTESEMIEDNVHQRQFVTERSLHSPPSPLSPVSQLSSFKQEANGDYSKQFPCENCDKVFTDPSNLQRHIRSTHVGARSHACPDCGKTFATSSGLKQHQHIHSSVKPFQCEVCLKAYTQFSNLCRHKRMHADCRQQIKCKDCGQAFSTMTSLSKHKRFCEGMLRNGARYPFQGSHNVSAPEKPTPVNPVASQASALSAAAYMNYYNPRPPFPFYSPLAPTFPIFPPGHPLAALTPPVLPDAKLPACPPPHILSASSPTSASTPKADMYNGTDKLNRFNSPKTADGSDLSDISQPNSDIDSHGSDADSESEHDRMSRKRASSMGSRASSGIPNLSVPVSRLLNTTSSTPSVSPGVRSSKSPHDVSDHKHKSSSDSGLLDLSKSSSGSSELPLDLSTKIKEVTPEKTPRKTHIFGDGHKNAMSPIENNVPVKIPSPAKKLHQAYPSPIPPSILMEDMYKMDKEKFQSLQERAARMMSLPRFPMPTPPVPPLHSMHGLIPQRSPYDHAKGFHPIMKMDVSPDAFPFNHTNKIKDRYSCKFCGKIFPRSANLTRHLRTHTGEQPYKCKYCERSFSISSNLQRHVRNIHNKEKPFKCPLCDRCFGQQTNLDRHLKKHESEGPNVIDSPPPGSEHELDEKEESYFDEIRNFIGKATSEDRGARDRINIDANFSITAQIEKQNQIKDLDKPNGVEADEDDLEDDVMTPRDDDDDVDEDEELGEIDDDDDDVEHHGSVKRPRLDNNNDDSGVENDRLLSNGFHSNSSELSKHLSGHYDVKSLTTPLTIST